MGQSFIKRKAHHQWLQIGLHFQIILRGHIPPRHHLCCAYIIVNNNVSNDPALIQINHRDILRIIDNACFLFIGFFIRCFTSSVLLIYFKTFKNNVIFYLHFVWADILLMYLMYEMNVVEFVGSHIYYG